MIVIPVFTVIKIIILWLRFMFFSILDSVYFSHDHQGHVTIDYMKSIRDIFLLWICLILTQVSPTYLLRTKKH